MQILPFKIGNKTIALSLDAVVSVGVPERIVLVPQAKPPEAGILLRDGMLLAMWNTGFLAGLTTESLKYCRQHIEVKIHDRVVAFPVDAVGQIISVSGWKLRPFYEINLYLPADTPVVEKETALI
ncbi:MAG: chemotaxis protein CheW [Brevinema sp.]